MRNVFRLGFIVLIATLVAGMAFATVERTAQGTEIFVPAAAHAPGAGGTYWTTDVRVYNAGTSRAASVTAYWLSRDTDNTSAMSATFTVAPGAVGMYEDVYVSLFNGSMDDVVAGGLRFTSSDPIIVTSRTFTPSDQIDGTFGQYIAGIPSENLVEVSSSRAKMAYTDILYVDDSAAFRTNLGLIDGSGTGSTVTLTAYDESGTSQGTMDVTLMPYEVKQLNGILAQMGLSGMTNMRIRVTVNTGAIAVYASQVDNASGDPIYIDGTNIIYQTGGGGGGTGTLTDGWYQGWQWLYSEDYWFGWNPFSTMELKVENNQVTAYNTFYFFVGTTYVWVLYNWLRANPDYVDPTYGYALMDPVTLPADGESVDFQWSFDLNLDAIYTDFAATCQMVIQGTFTGYGDGCYQFDQKQTRVCSGDPDAVDINVFNQELYGFFGVCPDATISYENPADIPAR